MGTEALPPAKTDAQLQRRPAFFHDDVSQLPQLPSAVWLYAGLMVLFSTVLPIYWVALAIQRMGPTRTAALGNLGPVLFGGSRLKPRKVAAEPAAAKAHA